MTAYHATHPEAYAPDCAECRPDELTVTDTDPWYYTFRAEQRAARDRSRIVTVACVLALAAMVVTAFIAGRAS